MHHRSSSRIKRIIWFAHWKRAIVHALRNLGYLDLFGKIQIHAKECQLVQVLGEYDYRHAKGILQSTRGEILADIYRLLNDPKVRLRLGAVSGKKQDLSRQLQEHFVRNGWNKEQPLFALRDLRYDLLKGDVPIEIEIGHERLVYAVFFKFLADYTHRKIPAGVMVVAENPKDFGHTWHNSRDNTRRKIEAISSSLLVPMLVLGIQP